MTKTTKITKIIMGVGVIIFWIWIIVSAIERGKISEFIAIALLSFGVLYALGKIEKLEDRIDTVYYFLNQRQNKQNHSKDDAEES